MIFVCCSDLKCYNDFICLVCDAASTKNNAVSTYCEKMMYIPLSKDIKAKQLEGSGYESGPKLGLHKIKVDFCDECYNYILQEHNKRHREIQFLGSDWYNAVIIFCNIWENMCINYKKKIYNSN